MVVSSQEANGLSGTVKQVGRIRRGDHLCLTFDTDDEQREVVTAFVLAGLSEGEKVVYFSDGTGRERISAWLREHGVDARAAWARGQLELRAAAATYLVAGTFDPGAMRTALAASAAEARRDGFAGLRATGEMSWALRTLTDLDCLAGYERGVRQLYDSGEVTSLCQYDRRLFGPAADRLARLHPWIVEADALHDDGTLRVTPMFAPRGLRIAGTVDHGTGPALAATLNRSLGDGGGDVHLDMSTLDFIDLAGLRVLVRAASDLGDRRLHVLNLAPALRQVMDLVGWGDAPGLVLRGDRSSA